MIRYDPGSSNSHKIQSSTLDFVFLDFVVHRTDRGAGCARSHRNTKGLARQSSLPLTCRIRASFFVTDFNFQMLFFTVLSFSLAALPFLVGAIPVSLNSPRTGRPISIPLKRHMNHLNRDGTVNHGRLEASLRHTEAFVLPLPFL